MTMRTFLPAAAITAALLASAAPSSAQDRLFGADKPLEIVDQGVFSIPGRYVEVDKQTIMVGQMYVQYQVPKRKTRPYPVVMIHGGGQTASNFLSTPDGRRGWADDFVANGYAVYVVDQSGRGRSGFFTDVYGKTRKSSVENASPRFTDTLGPVAAGEAAHAVAGTGRQGRSDVRFLLRDPGGDHRRRSPDRAHEPRSRRETARPHRPVDPARTFAGRPASAGRSPMNGRPWSKASSPSSPAARRSATTMPRDRPTISPTASSPGRGASRAAR